MRQLQRAVLTTLVTAAAIVSIAAQGGSTRADLLIRNATVIDATGAPPTLRTIVVRGGTIDALLDSGAQVPDSAVAVDGRGKYVIPGLWDMHVHLGIRPEPRIAEDIMLPLFLAHGVVGVRDMGGPLDRVLALRDGAAKSALTGPRIMTPGPFLDGPGDADPMFRRVSNAADARLAVADLVSRGVDFVKVQANLSDEAYAAIVAEARTRKVPVAGHAPVALPASRVVASGQRSIEHISPALVGDAGLLFACSSREQALRAELLAIERDRGTSKPEDIRPREAALRQQLVDTFDPAVAAALGKQIRDRGAWIVPTMIWSNSFRPLSPSDTGESLPLDFVPAATRTRWREGRARYLKAAPQEAFDAASQVARVSARAVGALHAAGARVLAGTDTFDAFVLPGVSLHHELALLVDAGLSPLEAIRAATRNAAAFRGVLATEGTIEKGKRADLVLLDADPLMDIRNITRVHAVVINGRLLARSDLDTLLERVRRAAY